MTVRHTRSEDLPVLLEIFEGARAFMAEQGNPNQWGPFGWPHADVIEEDIRIGKSYVIEEEGEIVGTFYLDVGDCPEPGYLTIQGDGWRYDAPYAVIHRIASRFTAKGILATAVSFALTKAEHVRIDTHEDNVPMRTGLAKLGFSYRGIVTLERGIVRLAFER